ncbi:N-6 DNA methylase [Streptosporangium canum]|uniref:N-6 DNA methylase n=1 Tax=Streptosporangium canum TaxID=324952 RepID=UPI003436F339
MLAGIGDGSVATAARIRPKVGQSLQDLFPQVAVELVQVGWATRVNGTTIPTAILVFRAPGTKDPERQGGVLFIDASNRFTKAKNRNILTNADIADIVTAYHSKLDADGEGGLAARFVTTVEIASNGYDLNTGRYIKQAVAEQEDLGSLIEAYNLARAERQKAEQHMLAVLAAAGIEGFNE